MDVNTKPKATALLLNWKRPDNLKQTIQSIRDQSASVEIFLWNNGEADRYDVDLQIDSSSNLMCWPRWFMANYASSDYVFSLDDDIVLNDECVIEDCINISDKNNSAVGLEGLKGENKMHRTKSGCKDIECDVLMGRFIFVRREWLKCVPMIPWSSCHKDYARVEDDIVVSSYLPRKIVPAYFRRRFKSLPEGKHSLWRQSDHFPIRRKFMEKFYEGKSFY